MGCTSGATEDDAGTMYPVNLWDTNGNYMSVSYAPAKKGSQPNTSARITQIWDARKSDGPTYTFTYDAVPHLTSVQAIVTPQESYNFTYLPQSIYEPFSNTTYAAYLLQAATTTLGPGSTFAYNTYGELAQYTSALGGSLQWQYRTWTYSSGISLREVSARQLQMKAGDAWHSYTFYHDDNTSYAAHYWTALWDNDAKAWKFWVFYLSGAAYALENAYYELHPLPGGIYPGNWSILFARGTAWSQDNGNLYANWIGKYLFDAPGVNYVVAVTTQALDAYGNLTVQNVYDYPNAGSVARTYNFSYLTDANYTSRYIRNRLLSAQVTVSATGVVTQLISNTYDAYSTTCGGASGLVSRTGLPMHDDTNYGTGFAYRGNVTTYSGLNGKADMTYESTGILSCTQDGAGKAVTTSPSPDTSYSLPGVLTPNANGNLSTSIGYNSAWSATSVVAPNSSTTTTSYDSYGRPSQSTIPQGATTSYTYTYYPSANTQTATMTAGDLANPIWKRTTLDGFGRVIRVESGYGASTNVVSTVDTQYAPCGCSPLGKVSAVSQPYAPGATPVWTTYAYDERGRVVSVTAPDGSVTSTQYLTTVTDPAGTTVTGNLVKTTDPAGKWKIQQTNAMGDLILVLEPNPAGGAYLQTIYGYNGPNQLTSVTMPRSNGTQTRSFSYSGTDLISATNPENGTVTYQYDGAHHVTQRTDAKGQVMKYEYDSYGRLNVVNYFPYPTQVVTQAIYHYDTNPIDTSFSANAWGRLTAVELYGQHYGGSPNVPSPPWYYEYSYDGVGQVTGQRLKIPDTSYSSTNFDAYYGWNQEGRLSFLQYPSGGPIYDYAFDGMGRLNTIYNQNPGCFGAGCNYWAVSGASYGPANELLTLNYFGTTESRTYNNLLQLTHQTVPGAMDMQYNYTPGQNNGRITSTTDGILGETVTYSYDPLNRLVNASSQGWGQAFSYDGFGNLTDKTPTAGSVPSLHVSFDPATNRQLGMSYDANGNLLQVGTYDAQNRLVTSVTGETYTYDDRGRRLTKVKTDGTWEFYFYGINGQKLMTMTCPTGNYDTLPLCTPSFNTYFKGKLLKSKGNVVATDRLGSVRWSATDGVQAYYPYGEERTTTSDNREKFGTYTRDNPGQDYADQRFYGVGTGRFYSPDPGWRTSFNRRIPTSWNLYSYVLGDPIGLTDIRGLNVDGCDASQPEDCEEPDCSEDECVDTPDVAGGGGDGTVYHSDTVFTVTGYGSADDEDGTGDDSQPPSPPQPPPTDPQGRPLPPNRPPPPAKDGSPNEWVPKPGTVNRPTKWVPKHSVHVPGGKGGQPSVSWDPLGHYDYIPGDGSPRTRFLPDGTAVDHNNNPLEKMVPVAVGVAGGAIILKILEGIATLAF
jgi:RHS repeat-associated protein